MISRVFGRAMMVGLMAVAMYLTYLVWQHYDLEFSSRVILTIPISALFLSNLSLLIQSITSFGNLEIKYDSLWYVLGGYTLLSEDEQVSKLNAHYCFLSWARSMVLAMFMIIGAIVIVTFYKLISIIILFLLNPYVPSISYSFFIFFGLFILALAFGLLAFAGFGYIEQKLSNLGVVLRTLILGAYGSLNFSLLLVSVMYLDDNPLRTYSWFQSVVLVFGIAYAFVLCAGLVIAISYGVVQLVRKASEKYSVLGNVWNTLCPVQDIHIIRS